MLVHESGEVANAREDDLVLIRIVPDSHAVALLEGHGEFQRVDGVEPQPLDEECRLGLDVRRLHVLQSQGFDDEFLEFLLESFHRDRSPLLTSLGRWGR